MTRPIIRFPGQYFDAETGLHYNRFRYYDPGIGRYVSADPIGQWGGANVYSYGWNNPQKFIDPYGLDIWTEGPSGNEPDYHTSINVGDPNGDYDSYSFGMSWPPPEGEVYADTETGGEIDRYMETTPEQDAEAKAQLEGELGDRSYYHPLNTCIDYSNDKFDEFKDRFGGNESPPPPRDPAPRSPYGWLRSKLATTTTTTTTTTNSGR